MDEDVTSNDEVGSVSLALALLCTKSFDNQFQDQWHNLQYEGKTVGQIHIQSKYIPPNPIQKQTTLNQSSLLKQPVNINV